MSSWMRPLGFTAPHTFDSDFAKEMDRFFGQMPGSQWNGGSLAGVRAALDMSETDEAITLKVDLPGMERDKLSIDLEDNTLRITGQKEATDEKKDDKGRVVHRERSFGSFSRSVALPRGVSESDISAEYKDGVLTIEIKKPSPSAATPSKIKIN